MREGERKRARELDAALRGAPASDDEIAALVETAEGAEELMKVEPADAPRQRALFVSGAATRKSGSTFGRIVAPVVVAAALIVVAVLASRTALPGETLYPVRQALDRVGLAANFDETVDRHIDNAEHAISEARRVVMLSPTRAARLAVKALKELGTAEHFLAGLQGDARADRQRRIDILTDRAATLLVTSADQPAESEIEGDDDSSGPGGGDDSGNDDGDSSGPGSGDDFDDDNSGPGSGDDGDDDSSGSGGGDDDSGPGSGDDGDDDSGPDSGDDGDDDSSGSGGGGSGGGGDDDDSGSGSDDELDDDERDDD